MKTAFLASAVGWVTFEDSILVGYDAESPGNQFQMFKVNVIAVKHRN